MLQGHIPMEDERQMTELTKPLAIALALGLIAPAAFAQDTATTPAADAPAAATTAPAADATTAPAADATATPAAEAPAKPAPDGPGTTYIAKTIDDWSLQCIHTVDGKDPCQMYQLLKDEHGTNVSDISMLPLPPGGKAVAGATIMTPLETLLTANLTLQIDTAQPKVYPFTFCAPPGCFARVGFTADELAAFKKGSSASMTIVPLAAPDQKVTVKISLKGFTAAYDEVTKINAENTK